jgi:Ser/Thr protein kinase RdoA (MazF antagonist)
VRDFHDAVAGFGPPPDARWQVLIPADGADIIAHHDLAPWNLVLGEPWTVIDWDAAAPGTRLGDLAYAAHGFVPLSADPRWAGVDAPARLRALVDGYGLDEPGRRGLLARLGPRTRSMATFLAGQAARGVEPWARLHREGHTATWTADADLIEARAAHWEWALLG